MAYNPNDYLGNFAWWAVQQSKKTGWLSPPSKQIQTLAVMPGVGAVGMGGKVAIAGALIGGSALAGILFRNTQSQQQEQKATTSAEGVDINAYQVPGGGPITVYQPKGGTATTEQQQTSTQVDTGGAMNVIMLAVVAGVAFLLLKR
jgi:uncharacterized membrane protein YebE (DUF533 family)